ncbi:tRNA (cytidine/uridine-2'-O-)-methyltransferase [Trueperella bonasi]|uniref:Putative tRNA (cytidine(34)-2'-O)-methyltransferase n=1 Tax=Trueperella bonasi TaxID=312286 RepID=A0ABT9NDU5_9ACTO|nr:tRNA (cytidine(34)-2'-O)-methyltransferase [Trueperella bonasi]MDP9805540.1 tRNA (cytidine/uridine-2'-O-)-methyltransferase [Trueperella bonasi]
MLDFVFHEPKIPGNTGNAIRLAACTGARLHLIEPLAFNFDDAHLKRAGLDYHDLADLIIHSSWDAAKEYFGPDRRIFAFTGHSTHSYADECYFVDDVLLFGTEPTGLPDSVLSDPRITKKLRIPMLPGRRSLNLANAASIAVYEAWRQFNFSHSAEIS